MLLTMSLVFMFQCVLAGNESAPKADLQSPVAPGAKVEKAAGGFQFTEGNTADPNQLLYFSDIPAGLIYKMTPEGKVSKFQKTNHSNGLQADKNGMLSNKKLFCSEGSDGMTLDDEGNVYLIWMDSVMIYTTCGKLVESIKIPESPTNVCFGDADRRTLYITARTSIYKLRMRTKGVGSN